MKIRPFTRKDIWGMLAVARKLHPTWFHESRLKSMPVDLHYQHGFVAVDGSKTVGFVSCSSEDGIPRICRLGVDPALRRRGLGRKLVAAVEKEARRAGAGTVQVMAMGWTRPFNRPHSETRAFYKALGFEVVRKHPIHEEGGDPPASYRRVAHDSERPDWLSRGECLAQRTCPLRLAVGSSLRSGHYRCHRRRLGLRGRDTRRG